MLFAHKQFVINAVVPNSCENPRGQKGSLRNINLGVNHISLKQLEFIALRHAKDASRRRCILFAHKQPMPQAALCEMFTHAAGSIRQNHRLDT
jgi:hypothetical protein